MPLFSKDCVPPNRWYFIEKGHQFIGSSFDEVAKKIKEFRSANKLPPGNPEIELETATCARWPEGCTRQSVPRGTFIGDVHHFVSVMTKFAGDGGRIVEKDEAERRAALCQGCHNNKPAGTRGGGCSSCRKAVNPAIDFIRARIVKGESTPYDAKLKACAICGCDLKLQVWIPREHLGVDEQTQNAYPTFCWKKT